jgi:UPF0755 protein
MRNLTSKITLAIFLISISALALFHQTYDFNDKNPGSEIVISIPDGATGVSIGKLLEDNSVIKSSKYFVDFYLVNQSAKSISPGIHRIQQHISTKFAVSQLLDQKRIESAITVKEGSTLSDVLNLLKNNKNIAYHNLSSKELRIPIPNKANSIEGQLFPAIYSFEPGTTYLRAIQSMLNKFEVTKEKIPLRNYGKYSSYEVLTIASILQVEGDQADFDKVARVIYNRLAINMPLQLNSTVQYAAGLRGRIALSLKATNINSPYNTYKYTGLPPTPISNPSEAAIKAASQPANGDWLYFITVKPGDTRFTNDFNEFQQWNTLYNNNLANGLFK